ncbi:MAG: O-antigen ligase domain-containing protein [Planctomycetota bacterium]
MLNQVALLGWPLVAVALFAWLRPKAAVLVTLLGGWMLLPMTGLIFPGLFLTKPVSISFGLVLGVVLFHPSKLTQFRPRWFDLPMFVLVVVTPLASSLLNGLGLNDGRYELLKMLNLWGVPYLVGRLYFKTQEDLLYLSKGFFFAGLAYVPLVLFEMRFSPQLHMMVYGRHQHRFDQVMRFGMYRPMVFLQHGLMLATWMAMATLCGYWLWMKGHLKRIGPVPMSFVVGFMLCVVVLCVSTGSTLLLLIGLVLLHASSYLQTRVLVLLLLLAVPGYMLVRGLSVWDAGEAVEVARLIDPGRASSLGTRIQSENLLVEHVRERFFFGWGGHNRYRDIASGQDIVVDGAWVFYYARNGLVGLLALIGVLLTPAAMVLWRGQRVWKSRAYAAPEALCVVTLLFAIDCLPNAMISPPYLLAGGALASVFASARTSRVQTKQTDQAPDGLTA